MVQQVCSVRPYQQTNFLVHVKWLACQGFMQEAMETKKLEEVQRKFANELASFCNLVGWPRCKWAQVALQSALSKQNRFARSKSQAIWEQYMHSYRSRRIIYHAQPVVWTIGLLIGAGIVEAFRGPRYPNLPALPAWVLLNIESWLECLFALVIAGVHDEAPGKGTHLKQQGQKRDLHAGNSPESYLTCQATTWHCSREQRQSGPYKILIYFYILWCCVCPVRSSREHTSIRFPVRMLDNTDQVAASPNILMEIGAGCLWTCTPKSASIFAHTAKQGLKPNITKVKVCIP